MNWKDIVIGSLATLVVTILSGVTIYYLTMEPPLEKKEKLVYEIVELGKFTGDTRAVGIKNVRVGNLGNMPAKDIYIAISYSAPTIQDKKITTSHGDTSMVSIVEESKEKLILKVQVLVPGEHISISLLQDQDIKPEIVVRSINTIGSEGDLRAALPVDSGFSLEAFLEYIILLLIISTGIIVIIFRFRILPRSSSLNNIAFTLLHSGMPEEALKILDNALKSGKDAPHSISNYALCLALTGQQTEAESYFDAAEFYSRSPHQKAVNQFNRAVAAIAASDQQSFETHIRKAIKLSKSEITKYIAFSKYIDLEVIEDELLREELIKIVNRISA